ncbi:ACP S-malonyltransferase [Lysinibacillus xylanilyticus]|uniref:ACP S-malonyltransferase n=1 Tax=Lysinibacillus xylanilyticus TaxID=582475 RepID=UPI002B25618C|nr:ACP S-malonyltransferase [Lysinibacillus xylanilyticus]MEB2302391.1 ACP S-malonyltransferase [Lysinibacillus xylanilyticus]
MQRIFFLMPGQGAQYVEMGKELCDKYPEVEQIYNTANEVLGIDIKGICFTGDMTELTKTENTQIAVFLSSVAAYQVLRNRYNFEPIGFAGHSLGEFSALVAAGSLDLESAIRLVRKRGEFMQAVSDSFPSKMVALRNISIQEIEKQCQVTSEKGKFVGIANYNAPNQIVITGYQEAVEEVVEQLTKQGADEIVVNVKTPFHTELMQAAADAFREEIMKYEFKQPEYEVIANLTGKPYQKDDDIKEILVQQITNPVKWIQTMDYLTGVDADLVLDIGPKDIVQKLAKYNQVSTPTFAFAKTEDLKTLTQKYLAPKTIINFVSKALGIAVSLKNYNDDIELYQEGVVKPYKRMEEIKTQVQYTADGISETDVNEIMSLLNTIFETKKTPQAEREKRMKELMEFSPEQKKDLVTV